MNFEECLERSAQAWCTEATAQFEMNEHLATEFACILKMETDRARRLAIDEAIKAVNVKDSEFPDSLEQKVIVLIEELKS